MVFQELRRRVGWLVHCDLLLEFRAGSLVDNLYPHRTAVGPGRDGQGQHTARGDGEGRAHVGKLRRTAGIVRDQLPAGVRSALEVDPDAVDGSGQRQFGGMRGGRPASL